MYQYSRVFPVYPSAANIMWKEETEFEIAVLMEEARLLHAIQVYRGIVIRLWFFVGFG